MGRVDAAIENSDLDRQPAMRKIPCAGRIDLRQIPLCPEVGIVGDIGRVPDVVRLGIEDMRIGTVGGDQTIH